MGYLVLFAMTAVGLHLWRIKRRKDRPPVAFKLLRGPGETLRRKLAESDENEFFRLLGAALAPWLVAYIPFSIAYRWKPQTLAEFCLLIGGSGLVFLAVLVLALRWTLGNLQRDRNNRLGYLGEREVAGHLQSLLAQGYHVFHDLPVRGTRAPFNIDHVAIGPGGVAIVETKTRRKGRARPGRKDHEVIYDGRQLSWPCWGEDTHGLTQALAEADWLRTFIRERTGIETPVKAILALPGWWVETRGTGAVTVVNSKAVAAVIAGRGQTALTAGQIDLITRAIDPLCRDVED